MARHDWIGLVIDAVQNGSAKLEILRRRPLVVEALAFDDGSAAPESLLRWLAFDASWLSRRSLPWPMLTTGRLTTYTSNAVADGRLLWLTSDHTDALLVGVAEEPPVVTSKPLKDHVGEAISLENVVSLVAPSFETWLAGQAGIIDRRDVLVADSVALDALRAVPALSTLTRYLPKPRAVDLPRLAPRADRVPLEPDAPLASDKARRAWLEEVVMCDDAPSVKPALGSMKRGARLTSFVDEVLQNAIVEGRLAAALEIIRGAPDVVNDEHANLAGALGRLDLLRILLDGGIDANATTSDDEPIVFAAARNGELACVELLVSRGANPRDALLGACDAYEGRGAAVGAWLLDHGADANTTEDGIPALHRAAHQGDIAFVETLLAHGADPHARTERGESVIDYANPHLPHGVEPPWFKKLEVVLADA